MSDYAKGKDSTFWKQYAHGRPVVPDTFFETILQYHAEHQGSLNILHEPGAGPGIHTARLAPAFKKAIISDVSQQNVDIAKQYSRIEHCDYRALNIEDALPEDGMIDMVVCLNMLHLCDLSKALTAIHRQLKAGGTFAYGFFAWPAFPDNKEAQDLLEQMCRRGLAWLRDEQGRSLNKVALFVSDGDVISSEGFKHVRRQRINYPQDFSWQKMLVPNGLTFDPWPEADADEVESLHDESWAFQMDVAGLQENIASHPWGRVPGLLDDLWPRMADAMKGQKINAIWPVTCILATKA